MAYDFVIVDVFTRSQFGGNQLAVLPNATGLTPELMQKVAREFNFAETTFVLPPDDPKNTRKVRIFTPKAEVPFAGHPTVGTAAALAELDGVSFEGGQASIVFEEGVGLVGVSIRRDGPDIYSQLTLQGGLASAPKEFPNNAQVAEVLSLGSSAVRGGWFASVGLPFAYAHLVSGEDVDRASLNRTAWSQVFSGGWSPHIFLFSGDLEDGKQLHARMFAPAFGIEEDPATGSACGALAAHLAQSAEGRQGSWTLQIDQGVAMGRPSSIMAIAEKDEGKVVRVHVGGHSKVVARGTILVAG